MKRLFLIAAALLPTASWSQTMSSIESVEYDPVYDRWLVSNNNNVIVVDDNGDEVSFFGSEPEADYGMEVMNDRLFAIVGASVRAYDLASGIEVMNIPVAGAQFLNGMASDGDHRIWVTDFGAKEIHEIDVSDELNPTVTQIVSNTVSTPNGIVYDAVNNRLVFVSWGGSAAIKEVLLTDYTVNTIVTTTVGNCDGIDNDNEGNFYISSWNNIPRITHFWNNFSESEVILSTGLSSPADLCYAEELDIIAIPNSGNNTITFINLGTASVGDIETAGSVFVQLNPASGMATITVDVENPGRLRIELLDATGRPIEQLSDLNAGTTRYKVFADLSKYASGVYFCRVLVGDHSETVKLVFE